MAGFTTAQDDALYDLTGWADDGRIHDLMITRMITCARDAGILPQ